MHLQTLLNCSIALLLIITGFTLCSPFSEIERIKQGDFQKVFKGYYENDFVLIPETGRFEPIIKQWRAKIESDKSLLSQIVRHYYNLSEIKEFEFKYVGYDSLNNNIILRYFGYNPNLTLVEGKPPPPAGWQVQFVFSLKEKRLNRVYTWELPLEE